MENSISVIVATYGDGNTWGPLGDRAIASVSNQTVPPSEVHRVHTTSLSSARNYGAYLSYKSRWLLFLDADDELEPDYLKNMLVNINANQIRYPSVRYVTEGDPDPEGSPVKILIKAPLDRGNFMVISSLIERSMFVKAGGFRELPAYEDWDLWIRAWMLGCEPTLVREAVLRVHKRFGSRNTTVKNPGLLCQEILAYNKNWRAQWKEDR